MEWRDHRTKLMWHPRVFSRRDNAKKCIDLSLTLIFRPSAVGPLVRGRRGQQLTFIHSFSQSRICWITLTADPAITISSLGGARVKGQGSATASCVRLNTVNDGH